MKKKDIKKLFESNGYKVLNIHIYAEGEQATITVQYTIMGYTSFRQYILTKYQYESDDSLIWCSYCVFGLETWHSGRIYKGGSND